METQNKAIVQNFDKFNQTTTTTLEYKTPIGYSVVLKTGLEDLNIQTGIRHVKSPNLDSLLIDVYMTKKDSWIFLRDGEMKIVCDNENINLKANEGTSKTGSSIYLEGGVTETVFYIIDKEILYKIANSSELSIRISGDSSYIDIKNIDNSIINFQIMCQQFYNNFYDNSLFTESLSKSLKPSGGGGCFIATAAMGDYDHPVVVDLRFFRDNWLLKRKWGVNFTNWYYTHGPIAANAIEKSIVLRKITFLLIVKPLQIITSRFK